MASFNLIDQPWIPVKDDKDNLVEMSLRSILLSPEQYKCIEAESPLETVALYRFLLALLHRALQGPQNIREAVSFWNNGWPQEKIESYFEQYYDRFDIFDDHRPFYQLADLPLEGYAQNWRKISVAEGSGNTTAPFNPATRQGVPKAFKDALTPAQAARKLFEHQTFALGGLIKKFITSSPGAPSASHALVIVQGENLLQTLLLQLVNYPYKQDQDQPVWEQQPYSMAWLKTDPTVYIQGVAQLYTWFSRSIRLYPEKVSGQWQVRQLAYASGLRPHKLSDEQRDPMVAFIAGKKGYYPVSFRSNRALWRDYQAMIPESGEKDKLPPDVVEHALGVLERSGDDLPLRYTIFGQVNDQAKVLLWRQENYPLPLALLQDEENRVIEVVELALEIAEETAKALSLAVWHLARHLIAQGGREPDAAKDISPMKDSLPYQKVYWSRLENAFSKWLDLLQPDFDRSICLMEWEQFVLAAGDEAWQATLHAVGQNSRSFRAIALAQGTWWKHRKKLKESGEVNMIQEDNQ